jgi:hypothetical protein
MAVTQVELEQAPVVAAVVVAAGSWWFQHFRPR